MAKPSSNDFDNDHTDELPVLLETVALGDEAESPFAEAHVDATGQHTALYPAAGHSGTHTSELRFELAERIDQIGSLEAQIASLTDRSRDLDLELAEKNELVGELQRTIAALRQSLEESNTTERRLAAEGAAREGRIAELTADVERLRDASALQAAEIDRLSAAEAAARRDAATLQDAVAERSPAHTPEPDLQALLEDKAALSDYIAGRRAWWEDAQAKEASLAARVASLEQELVDRGKRLEEAEAFAERESSRAVALRAELVEYGRRVAALEREQREAGVAAAPTPESAAAIVLPREPVVDEAVENPAVAEAAAAAAAAAPTVARDVPAVAEIVEAATPAVEAVAQLEAEVEYKRQQVAAQLVALRDRDQQLRAATNELEHTRRELAAMRTELESSRAGVARLERAVIDKDRALEARDARITTLQDELKHRAGAIEKLNAIDFALPKTDPPQTRIGSLETAADHLSGPALLCLTGDAPKRFALAKRTVTVGRGAHCDLQIITHVVSREHARITVSADSALIEDLGSRNGVFVNSVRVDRQALQQGDLITIGDTQFRFVESMAH